MTIISTLGQASSGQAATAGALGARYQCALGKYLESLMQSLHLLESLGEFSNSQCTSAHH